MKVYFDHLVLEIKKDVKAVIRFLFVALGKLVFKEFSAKDDTFIVFSNDAVLNQKMVSIASANEASMLATSAAKVASKVKSTKKSKSKKR
jgi:D-alanyl-lipoteichoic acid acyltransferase DltB (MBOAT superfamily)